MRLFRFGFLCLTFFTFVQFSIADEQDPIPGQSLFISQPETIVAAINSSEVTRTILTQDLNQRKSNAFGSLLKLTKNLSGGNAASPSIAYVKALDDHQGLIPRGSGFAMKLGSLIDRRTSTLTYADLSAHATIDASWIGINVGW